MGQTLLSSTMSLARFAREHDLNHNQLARWRREYEQGTYGAVAQVGAEFVPVCVAPVDRRPSPVVSSAGATATVELHLPKGRIAPSRPIDRGIPGPDLLANVLVSKFCDHQPLYRRRVRWEREGIDLPESTLGDWVGGGSALLSPLVAAVERYVMSGNKVHGTLSWMLLVGAGHGKAMMEKAREQLGVGAPGASLKFESSPDLGV
jgi:hypothetical protein